MSKGTIFNRLHGYSMLLFFVFALICIVFVYFGTINSVGIYVDGELEKEVNTTSRTVGELFAEIELETHEKDRINRAPGARLQRNDYIHIEKAFPVFVSVDETIMEVWTAPATVEEFLETEEVELGQFDEIEPGLDEELEAYQDIEILRIEKIYTAKETSIPYESVHRSNSSLDRGMFRVISEGEEGVKKEKVEIVIADGEEVSREVVEEQIVEPPKNEIIENGTRAVIPDTDLEFQQSFNMSATAYCICPVCTGTGSGVTATGAPAVAGSGTKNNPHVIAVDPGVIPLHSTVYIDGYGYAVALDTGGAIRGNKIDLLFATHQQALSFGRRNLKVYLLE